MVADGPHGLRVQPVEADHVGIGGSLPATCFPTASAIASSWNPELLYAVGEALAQLAVGIVDGIQSRGVGTSVKHFAANNQEDDRLRVDAQVDDRTLREVYLPAFERVVTGSQPWTVMCSYNKVNGVSASENRWLLTTVLRDEWGFDGLVVSDWGAVYHRVPALVAGLDLEMPPKLGRSPEAVVAAVRSGEISEQLLDERTRTVLQLVDRGAHVLELDEGFDVDDHHALARRAAAFPFGFGLSYTSFDLSDLNVELTGDVSDETLSATVSVTVTNTRDTAGSHVVQVYVRDLESSVHRPVRELKGFARVDLEPGASDRVTIPLDQRAFSFWSELFGRWVVEPGEFAIDVGRHSRDLPLSRICVVDGPEHRPPLTADSTLHEWTTDPIGRQLLSEAAADGAPDPLQDPELVRVVGTMPMSTLAGFGPLAPDYDTLDRLVDEWRARKGSDTPGVVDSTGKRHW